MNKIALDDAAKKYYKLLWGEYGEQLVREIPRRIKAALIANKRLASAQEEGIVLPAACVRAADGGLLIEGMYRDSGTKVMFLASLDKECNVREIKSFQLR